MKSPFIAKKMIAHFKNLVESKMCVQPDVGHRTGLLAGGILFLVLLVPAIPMVHAETEEVKVISRKPDPSDPLFELTEVEGGLLFRVPKDMTFVKQYGVISPISSDEYCAKKIEKVNGQIEKLNDRVAELERKTGVSAVQKNEESL